MWLDKIKENAAELIMVAGRLDGEVDKQTIDFRTKVCLGCDQNSYREEGRLGMCNKCKCVLSVKVKTKTERTLKGTKVTHCPLGKWQDDNIKVFYNFLNS